VPILLLYINWGMQILDYENVEPHSLPTSEIRPIFFALFEKKSFKGSVYSQLLQKK